MKLTKQQFVEGILRRAEVLRRHKLLLPEKPFLPVEIDEQRAKAQRARKDGGKHYRRFF